MPLFPHNIDTFYDLFCGGCNVAININANQIMCNDIETVVINLMNDLVKLDSIEALEILKNTINMYQLSKTNEEGFKKIRSDYNAGNKNWDMFYAMLTNAFNNQMRFNNRKQYNSSFGYEASTMNPNIRNNVNLFVSKIQEKNIIFQSKDFRDVELDNLSSKDLVYVDPPYSVSRAVYQDGKRGFKGWGSQDDIELCQLLDKLNDQGIRFAMSNMTESKGNINEYLIEWAKKYNLYDLSMNYSNASYQRKKKGVDKEVLITNYEVNL